MTQPRGLSGRKRALIVLACDEPKRALSRPVSVSAVRSKASATRWVIFLNSMVAFSVCRLAAINLLAGFTSGSRAARDYLFRRRMSSSVEDGARRRLLLPARAILPGCRNYNERCQPAKSIAGSISGSFTETTVYVEHTRAPMTDTPSKSRRRWFQFSLVTMFAGVTLAACAMPWAARAWELRHREPGRISGGITSPR